MREPQVQRHALHREHILDRQRQPQQGGRFGFILPGAPGDQAAVGGIGLRRASSAVRVRKAWMAGSSRSMRSRQAWVSARLETFAAS